MSQGAVESFQEAQQYIDEELLNSRFIPDADLPEYVTEALEGLLERVEAVMYETVPVIPTKDATALTQDPFNWAFNKIVPASRDIFPAATSRSNAIGRNSDLLLEMDSEAIRIKTHADHGGGQMLFQVGHYTAKYEKGEKTDDNPRGDQDVSVANELCSQKEITVGCWPPNRGRGSHFYMRVAGWPEVTPELVGGVYTHTYTQESGTGLRPPYALVLNESRLALVAAAQYL